MKRLFTLFFLLIFTAQVFSQDIPERPVPPRLVNDFANVLSEQEIEQLETELVQFDKKTSVQICIVTLPSLNGMAISDLSFRIGEKWGVGQKGKNNGIVIVFKPKRDNEKGQVFVAVGYGLEGIIPDAVANREVVDYEMLPSFRKNDIYGGLSAGTKVLMGLAAQEFTAADYVGETSKDKGGDGGIFVVILIIIVLVSIFKGGGGGHYNSKGALPFWLAMGLMNGSRGRGSYGGFSGGSGGGGFGGFGGGSFGGGGAGGSW